MGLAMKIFFSAVEASGDRLAAGVIKQLKSIDSTLDIVGFGSFDMQQSGMKLLDDYTSLSAIGLVESVRNLFIGLRTLRLMKKIIVSENPDLMVLVDAPGFNMNLATFAKKQNIKVVYFIPPQNYLWDGKKRGLAVVKRTDKILTIYKSGYDFYRELGANCSFVGHPLLNLYNNYLQEKKVVKSVNKKEVDGQIKIGMIPGTRKHELKKLLPIYIEVAKRLNRKHSNIVFLWAGYGKYQKAILQQHLSKEKFNYKIISENSFALAEMSDLVLVKSGTATLEVVLTGTAQLIVYKISSLSYFIFKHIWRVGRKLKFIGLPNLIAGRKIVDELLQNDVSVNNIEKKLNDLLNVKSKVIFDMSSHLGPKNSFELVAQNILELAMRGN